MAGICAYITCMQMTRDLSTVADDELLRRLAALLAGSRHTEADLVAHIGEADARRLYAREATPSMFAYCTERLHLSEAEACLRIAAARASREHPVLLEMLADGRLHLSAIAKIGPHLTPGNRDALLRRATRKTKREIDELVAELAPRPDVTACIRKLPAGRFVGRTDSARPTSLDPSSRTDSPGVAHLERGPSPRPEQVDSSHSGVARGSSEAQGAAVRLFDVNRETERAASSSLESESTTPSGREPGSHDGLRWVAAPTSRLPSIEPLSPARYKVQFTASAELREKLERLQALMRSSHPDGDLAAVIEAAVTEKLERLEARRFGRTKSPRKTIAESEIAPRTRHVPAAVKRAVGERDEHRCRYVDAHGNRCPARARLEYHHRHTFALGGNHSPGNVSLLCRVHNRLMAEVDYGAEALSGHRGASRASVPACQPDFGTG